MTSRWPIRPLRTTSPGCARPTACRRWTATNSKRAQIVISIADRAVPFGTVDPEAVQFFEGYSIGADGGCVWEPY